MKTINKRQKFLFVKASVLLAVVMQGWLAQAVHAQFTSPPGQGTPKGTAGGGSRPPYPSSCLKNPNSQNVLRAMAPTRSMGLTSIATPTLWIDVPDTPAKTLEFSLFTAAKAGVYQTNLPVHSSGLLRVNLPARVALIPDKPYYWSAALVCNPQRRTEDWVVGGWIQRRSLSPELQHQLASATPEQRVTLYLQSGFWYEAFNTYLELRQTQSTNPNLATIWADLLKAAGLNASAIPSLSSQAAP